VILLGLRAVVLHAVSAALAETCGRKRTGVEGVRELTVMQLEQRYQSAAALRTIFCGAIIGDVMPRPAPSNTRLATAN